MTYSKINNLLGWLTFSIAAITYILTLEPTASYWDCGEFISAAFKLQIVHQPGAPLFLMIGKLFSLFASDPTKVAYMVNLSSALSSAATIMFLFWTITALGKKVSLTTNTPLNNTTLIAIMGAGLVGALAYAFSDSFWFSAVEAEVYAMSSLSTAIVFWAILKWDAHADEPYADKWLLFIAYVMGLSIGIHLLNLLVIPAMALVYYFRKNAVATTKGVFSALFVGVLILGFIQYGIIQYLIKFGAYFDLFFVNTLGFGFGSGVIFFAILVIGATIWLTLYSIKKRKPVLNLAMLSFIFILFGYSSFAMIVIRAKANPTLNNSNPQDAFSFLSYLNREQYGDRPLLYGQYFDSKPVDTKQKGNIYVKGEKKYEIAGQKQSYEYDRNTLFPRMYSDDGNHPAVYRDWMELGPQESPTFATNIGWFGTYQIGFMYMRYFLWNFAGRQNDVQGIGDYTSGNWISGIKFLDALRLGDQSHLPDSITKNKANNQLFFLPLILGILGAFWHFKYSQKDAGIVALLFFFTGLAIVIYLNQTPSQPRERDYAYVGSFYAFAIWIGLGVFAIAQWLRKVVTPKTAAIGATAISLLAAPVLMASQEWNDHDRSTKTTARDLAKNYLASCAPNAILFTYGDNDTYPLWYVQEVENFRPDIRIVNLSLFDTDWYINQLRRPFNQSAPLPITMQASMYKTGTRDVLFYQNFNLEGSQELKDVFEFITSDNPEAKVEYQSGRSENFLPTKNFKMAINPAQVLATKTVDANQANAIVPQMEWTFPGNYLTKGQLAILDILVHNKWERPIYFAFTVPNSNFLGLDNYLFSEGFALRLQPKTKATIPSESPLGPTETVNTKEMYTNMMTKFDWGSIKTSPYLDPESEKMVFLSVNKFNELAKNLIFEGKTDSARNVIKECLKVMPINTTYDSNFALSKYELVSLMYQLGLKTDATALLKQTENLVTQELDYHYSIIQGKENLAGRDIQLNLFVLSQFVEMTKQYGENALHKELDGKMKTYEGKFGFSR
ncbi:protein O-mannosyl-transferase family [Pelobium manganitolerans]|uniref:protein O-mannosyl-transferase family n=1 Tax=Pelobium manganitolerans TaxID=1842495 RepID=UPI003FA366FB